MQLNQHFSNFEEQIGNVEVSIAQQQAALDRLHDLSDLGFKYEGKPIISSIFEELRKKIRNLIEKEVTTEMTRKLDKYTMAHDFDRFSQRVTERDEKAEEKMTKMEAKILELFAGQSEQKGDTKKSKMKF